MEKVYTYKEILCKVPNYIALDISVNSTGYVRCINGKVDYGTYKLKAQEDAERREEFGIFLMWLLGGKQYNFIVLEDVIFGNNYKTTKILMQLNVVIEDLMLYGRCIKSPVKRINNLTWKKILETISGYKKRIKCGDDKERIRESLALLGLWNTTMKQDICDAFGIAIAYIAQTQGLIPEVKETVRVRTDLLHGYIIEQVATEALLNERALELVKRRRKNKEIHWLRTDTKERNLLKQFEKYVIEHGDRGLFCIVYDVNRVGTLLLTKYVNIEQCEDEIYLCVYRRG